MTSGEGWVGWSEIPLCDICSSQEVSTVSGGRTPNVHVYRKGLTVDMSHSDERSEWREGVGGIVTAERAAREGR